MGPNGSGKSTLSYILSGREDYEVTEGDILYNGESILELDLDRCLDRKGRCRASRFPSGAARPATGPADTRSAWNDSMSINIRNPDRTNVRSKGVLCSGQLM
jgi:ABC-type glutathione transport system ATPase component